MHTLYYMDGCAGARMTKLSDHTGLLDNCTDAANPTLQSVVGACLVQLMLGSLSYVLFCSRVMILSDHMYLQCAHLADGDVLLLL